jgi:hypothetical protein
MSLPSELPLPADEDAGLHIAAEVVPEVGSAEHLRSLQPPLTLRELVGVALLVALCDVTIYRGAGFAGLALLFLLAPLLLLLASPRPRLRAGFWLVGGMLMLLAARLLWMGSELGAAIGFLLLVALCVALDGRRPHVIDTIVCGFQSLASGWHGLKFYEKSIARLGPQFPRLMWLSVLLPLAALVLFGALFVLANPALATWFDQEIERTFRWLANMLGDLGGDFKEMAFWIIVAWVSIGLLRPVWHYYALESLANSSAADRQTTGAQPPQDSPLYAALRNTLLAVIVLFAVYLVFEFQTLWFRQFPPGFYYAGYAHQGAAWLTVALALATIVLSLIFRGQVLADGRVNRLKRLAWIWSAENLLLALAVYNRMLIYINFNGMSPMRTIGLFGISTVVVGFVLVLWKINRQRDFAWLIRGQLAALALAVYLYALTPVDALVNSYNVRQVMAGNLPPAVQISVHPIDSEGLLVLQPLVDCEDPIIRDGIRALLVAHAIATDRRTQQGELLGWTTYQIADNRVIQAQIDQLARRHADWAPYFNDAKRQRALDRFNAYVYQWY